MTSNDMRRVVQQSKICAAPEPAATSALEAELEMAPEMDWTNEPYYEHPDWTVADDFSQLTSAEIFLLENWDFTDRREMNHQRDEIFSKYIQKGVSGRWQYHMRAVNRQFHPPGQVEVDGILTKIRAPIHRAAGLQLSRARTCLWLRTHYDPLIQEFYPQFKDEFYSQFKDEELARVTNNENTTEVECFFLGDRYGRVKDIHDIFMWIPEIVDCFTGPLDPMIYFECMKGARRGAVNVTDDPFNRLNDIESDGASLMARLTAQWAHVTGTLWVHNERTTQTGEMNLLWLDEYGETIGLAYVTPTELRQGYTALVDPCQARFGLHQRGQKYKNGAWPALGGYEAFLHMRVSDLWTASDGGDRALLWSMKKN